MVLTLVLVIMTTGYPSTSNGGNNGNTSTWKTTLDGLVNGPGAVPLGLIPWSMYVFSLLGALGFVFTSLFDDFDREAGKVFEDDFRLPAALLLGAGVYLLADVIVDDAVESDTFMLGIVFLAGLYVNRAYEHFGALTDRFLPASKDRSDEDDGAESNDDTRGNDPDEGDENSIE